MSNSVPSKIDEAEFLNNPAKAFEEAEKKGSVVVTRNGKPRFVLTIPLTEMTDVYSS